MEHDYFESYSNIEIHERMLNDRIRNEAYKEAILTNQEYFKDRVVLDVGAGTGILSVMCAKAGAKHVYAVEASEIVHILENIIKENEVENVVQIIRSKIEEVQLPEKADIIISEWMGFYLLHEGMLDSVIVARDKFLKEDGILFPDTSELFVAPCCLPSLFSYWRDVGGVSMKSFGEKIRKLYYGKPKVMRVLSKHLIADEVRIAEFSLKNLTVDELDVIKSKFYTVSKSDTKYQGLCIWFSVTFPSLCENSVEIILNTAPNSDPTHWEQTVIVLQNDIDLEEGGLIVGYLLMKRDVVNPRFYNIEFEVLDPDEEEHPVPCECYDTKCRIIKSLSDQYNERDMDMNSVD